MSTDEEVEVQLTTDSDETRDGHSLKDDVLTTYRYLRMALITVLAMLAAAVLVQTFWSKTGGSPDLAHPSWETSISYYFWTPVRSVFVGSLIAMGLGMVVLKADNEIEDILLNIAGVLAPVVALVPTPQHCVDKNGKCVVPPLDGVLAEGVRNNISALIGAGLVALIIFGLLAYNARLNWPRGRILIARAIGLVLLLALLVIGVIWFSEDRVDFTTRAHITAAVILFACIVVVVVLNAVTQLILRTHHTPGSGKRAAAYLTVAGLMAIGFAAAVVMHERPGGFIGVDKAYATFFIEAWTLVLFFVFWVIQSRELWNTGTRFAAHQPTLLPSSGAKPRPRLGR